jgi:hypothetical protein
MAVNGDEALAFKTATISSASTSSSSMLIIAWAIKAQQIFIYAGRISRRDRILRTEIVSSSSRRGIPSSGPSQRRLPTSAAKAR